MAARRGRARRPSPSPATTATGTLRAMRDDLDALAGRIHDILRIAPGSSPEHRALHAKGVIASGGFTATGELAGLTTAAHLTGGTTPAIARFSHPGGDPNVSDA